MRFLGWIATVLLVVVGTLYMIVFTPVGNGLLKPFIEKEIAKNTHLPSKLGKFELGFDSFYIVLELNPKNTITLNGVYSLFEQTFNVNYNVNLGELKTLQPLTQTQLQDSFFSDGNVQGNLEFIKVDGKSDVAKSNTTYHIELTKFNPTSIIAKMDSVDLKSLLHMLNQKMYATAQVDVDVNFKDIKPHQLDGNIKVTTLKGKLNTQVMQKDFGITIPKTNFTMDLSADMKGDDIDYIYSFNSNLAKIASGGHVVAEPLNINATYKFDVKELAVLKPLTGADVRGPLHLKGSLSGTKAKMKLDGKTDIAASKTSFVVHLKEFQPADIALRMKALHLNKLLYMVKQPHYADALVDMDVKISDADVKHLQGNIDTKIYKGTLDSRYLTKAYEFASPMPRTHFDATTHTRLDVNHINTKVTLHSTLADLNVKDAVFDMKDASLLSDYKVQLHNLNKLFFVTQRHLKGKLIATGEVRKAKDLDFTMHSKIAQGVMDVKLHNDDLHVDMNKLQTLDILDMLLYPKVIKSKIDAKLDYNLVAAKGNLKGYITQGHFTKNQVLDLTKKYAKIDLYKQTFKGDVGADINKEKIFATLDLKSNTSEIKTTNTKLDTLKQTIKSTLEITANKHPLTVKLHGAIDSPKVEVDASKLVTKETKKVLEKEIDKHIKDENLKKLLKGFF